MTRKKSSPHKVDSSPVDDESLVNSPPLSVSQKSLRSASTLSRRVSKKTNSVASSSRREARIRSSARLRDANAPKRPSNAYQMFYKEKRPLLVKENPLDTFVELNRKIGQLWAALPDEKKQAFKLLSENEHKEYERAFERYKKSKEYRQFQELLKVHNAKSQSLDSKKAEFRKGTDVSIFSADFLRWNEGREEALKRNREEQSDLRDEIRSLRQSCDELAATVAEQQRLATGWRSAAVAVASRSAKLRLVAKSAAHRARRSSATSPH